MRAPREQREVWPRLIADLRTRRSRAIEVLLDLTLRVAELFQENAPTWTSAPG